MSYNEQNTESQNTTNNSVSLLGGTFYALIIGFGLQIAPLLFVESGTIDCSIIITFEVIGIVFFGILLMCRTNEYKLPETTKNSLTWRSVTLKQFSEFLVEQDSVKEQGAVRVLDLIFDNLLIKIILIIVSLYFAFDGDILKSAIAVDLAFVPAIILRPFKEAKSPYQLLDRSKVHIQTLANNPIIFPHSIVPQFAIATTAENRPIIQDKIRLNLEFNDQPKDWLCNMISYTENDVQSKKYPYLYYVLVIKGRAAYSNTSFTNAIRSILSEIGEENSSFLSNGNIWQLEAKTDDGNSVFVIRKSDSAKPAYTTTPKEADQLVDIAKRIYIIRDMLQPYVKEEEKPKNRINIKKKKPYKL